MYYKRSFRLGYLKILTW